MGPFVTNAGNVICDAEVQEWEDTTTSSAISGGPLTLRENDRGWCCRVFSFQTP